MYVLFMYISESIVLYALSTCTGKSVWNMCSSRTYKYMDVRMHIGSVYVYVLHASRSNCVCKELFNSLTSFSCLRKRDPVEFNCLAITNMKLLLQH